MKKVFLSLVVVLSVLSAVSANAVCRAFNVTMIVERVGAYSQNHGGYRVSGRYIFGNRTYPVTVYMSSPPQSNRVTITVDRCDPT